MGKKEQVIHLVGVHDKIEGLTDPYEVALMMTDTLGMIDMGRVKPTFDRAGGLRFCADDLFGRRILKFQEGRWKDLGLRMADRLEEYFRGLI